VCGVWEGQRKNEIEPRQRFCREGLEVNNIVGPPMNVMHRAVCLKRTGQFSEDPVIMKHSCEDWDLWLRICDIYPLRHVEQTLGKFVFHGNNRSGSVDFFASRARLFEQRIKKFKAKQQLPRHAFNVMFPLSMDFMMQPRLAAYEKRIKTRLLDFKMGRDKRILELFCRGMNNYAKGNFSSARSRFAAIIKDCRGQLFFDKQVTHNLMKYLYYLHGSCEEHLGHLKRALSDHRAALFYDRNFLPAKAMLPLLYYRLKNYALALKLARRTPTASGSNMEGIYFVRRGRYREAMACFRKAIRIDARFKTPYQNIKLIQRFYKREMKACR
jgi:tetratricopeptide (TPR) repeat protein